uniref:Major sperm protein n=4 Tax=Meloidogyne TaxID=189290 RepID=A0A914LR80_MELIC
MKKLFRFGVELFINVVIVALLYTSTIDNISSRMAVSLDPESIQVAAAGGEITLQLKNSSAEGRYAFKVKCTDNDHYRVNPVFGFVDPAGNAAVLVRRTEGPPKADGRLEVHFIPAPADATDAKALFPPGSSSEFKLNVPLIAE